MKYFHEESHYNDRYDRDTVTECRRLEERFGNTGASTAQRAAAPWDKLLLAVAIHFLTGERFGEKKETVRCWMKEDSERQRHVDDARVPLGISCLACRKLMDCIDRDLSDHDGKELVLFIFKCPGCSQRRAFYETGEEFRSKSEPCPRCRRGTVEKTSREGNVITIRNICPECNHETVHTLDLRPKPVVIDPAYVEDRNRFCLSDEEGNTYLQNREKNRAIDRGLAADKERAKKKVLFDEIAKLQKLTIGPLQKLLTPLFEKAAFSHFELGTPNIRADVQVPFTVHDTQDGREERASTKELTKIVQEALQNTNWRLMSSGIHYHLGILQGWLRGFETEKDLLELVENRRKMEKNKA